MSTIHSPLQILADRYSRTKLHNLVSDYLHSIYKLGSGDGELVEFITGEGYQLLLNVYDFQSTDHLNKRLFNLILLMK